MVSSFLARAFAPYLCNLIQSFSSQPLLVSMATKFSNSEDQTLGANLPTKGQIHKPSRGQKDPEELGASGSDPSHLPSWSLARKPLPSHPNTRHCLGIHVTLIKETGATPPPPHTWMAPLVEDVLCYGRPGLTEAIVTGPKRADLFYGRWSMGEGPEPREGKICCIYTHRSGYLGW